MARTIGRHWTGEPGDYQAACEYCGVVWLRSKLRRDASGRLSCPDEGEGRDQVTLDRANRAASRPRRPARRVDGTLPRDVIVPVVNPAGSLVPPGSRNPTW